MTTPTFDWFVSVVKDYANRQDWSADLVGLWCSMAEEKFNAELRIDRMIQFDQALIASRCASIPEDWLEFVSNAGVKIQNDNGADGFLPIRYLARDEFFNLRDNWAYGFYTIQGRQIYIGGTPDAVNGQTVKLTYYRNVPDFHALGESWLVIEHPSLYLAAVMMNSYLHAVGEEDKAAGAKQLVEDGIQKLNANHLRSKASGSRVTRSRVRSFG